ncbi:protein DETOXIFICATION 12-like isoform X2 [Hibiscus syriacus]|uniref:protein DETOXIFICATION 12-like isoform X2 n=1 Tax=Hibiscus syriacus TaxID=106335 RepID=UPI00192333E0|nr:protein DETOXIFICATION 12-like isoform X2 [Hibiscus syriacus]
MSALYPIPEGIGAAASTRVSNELGAGNPRLARFTAFIALSIAVLESITVSAVLVSSRHVFGYVFSNDKEVVSYVTDMAPLLAVSVILDSLQAVLSGIARGSGWQDLGAYINLTAYYLCGVLVAGVLGFWVQMRGKGLWIGIQSDALLQTLLLSAITSCIDWHKQARKARDRLSARAVET